MRQEKSSFILCYCIVPVSPTANTRAMNTRSRISRINESCDSPREIARDRGLFRDENVGTSLEPASAILLVPGRHQDSR